MNALSARRTRDKRQVQGTVSQLVSVSIESLAEMVRKRGFLILHELNLREREGAPTLNERTNFRRTRSDPTIFWTRELVKLMK